MNKFGRIYLFLISLPILCAVFWFADSNLNFSTSIGTILFSSAITLAFTTLFIEHFFVRPADVLSASMAILLMLAPLHSELSALGNWYWIFFIYNFLQAVMALMSMLLANQMLSKDNIQNKVASKLKTICVHTGNGRILFFLMTFLCLLFYVDSQSKEFLWIGAYSSFWLLVEPKTLLAKLNRSEKSNENDLGKIFGVQSRNTFLVKLYEDRKVLKRFDLVEFRYSTDQKIRRGMIIDNYYLDASQWVKVLCTDELKSALSGSPTNQIKEDNILYKIDAEKPNFIENFVGVILEGSDILKIKFEYAFKATVSEGSLVQLHNEGQTIYYQIIQGRTAIEILESKNEAGIIVGEAVQLGCWLEEKRTFQRYGWVPSINTPLYLAAEIETIEVNPEEYLAGIVPNSNFPVLLNKSDAVTHHTAILGVTGSGKSVFARDLLRNLVKDGQKIILVDFTGEHKKRLRDLRISNILQSEREEKVVSDAVKIVDAEKSKGFNKNAELILNKEKEIHEAYVGGIKRFLENDDNVGLFELPNVENTSLTLELTRCFFKTLFAIAKYKNNYGKKVCVVLEEAHTVVPEHNFAGVSDQSARGLINSIGQIALQGRKYNIGFLLIAQRTANVSKTVLTQCNSIIAFQQFDKTSGDFLTNYIGPELVAALPILGPRKAIAVGKAFRTTSPMIFEVPHIEEPEAVDDETSSLLSQVNSTTLEDDIEPPMEIEQGQPS